MKIKFFTILTILLLNSCATKQTKPILIIPKTESLINPEVISSSVSEEDLKQGKTTFEGRCTSCHQLYEPKEFDKNEWKSITHRMQKKAHLDDLEIEKVYNYIISNLK
jgi:cytochrome c5